MKWNPFTSVTYVKAIMHIANKIQNTTWKQRQRQHRQQQQQQQQLFHSQHVCVCVCNKWMKKSAPGFSGTDTHTYSHMCTAKMANKTGCNSFVIVFFTFVLWYVVCRFEVEFVSFPSLYLSLSHFFSLLCIRKTYAKVANKSVHIRFLLHSIVWSFFSCHFICRWINYHVSVCFCVAVDFFLLLCSLSI